MLSCREVATLIASDELATAGWWRRFTVRAHLFMCRHCRGYAGQIRALGTAARAESEPTSEEKGRLERLERSLLERAKRGDPGPGRQPD